MKTRKWFWAVVGLCLAACSAPVADSSFLSAHYLNMGMRKTRHGQYQKAIPYFHKALNEDPHNIAAREQLAEAHYHLGNEFLEWRQFEKARDQFLISLDINPAFAPALRGLDAANRRLEVTSLSTK